MMVANFLLSCAGSIQLAKLNKASRNPQKAASTTLRNIITYAKDTAYGKEHNFEQILQARPMKNSSSSGRPMSLSTNTRIFVPMSRGTKTAKPMCSSRANQ